MYTTQAPDGSSGLICSSGELSVWHRLLQTRGKSVGDRDPGGIGQTEGFLWQPAGKLSSWGKYDPGNAAKVRERAQDRNTLRESFWGRLGWPREQHFLIHLIFHELKTPFHTSTHWKTFHLESTCSSLSDHSSWWFWVFCSLEKDSLFETLIKR